MKFIENNSHDCYYNHALEEYYLRFGNDDIASLWINSPSILVGRNQNTLREINLPFVREHGIEVVRRPSGGGTVFNDLGNMNFTFLLKRDDNRGFSGFAEPVVEALRSVGVAASFSGRNDILIDGKKFSGNAQYHAKEGVLHHGTLLFDSDPVLVSQALKSRPEKFKDKSVKSVASRITTIREHLKQDMTLAEFRSYLKKFIMDWHGITEVTEPSEEDKRGIEQIANEKYRTYEWNYGNSPNFELEFFQKHPSGLIEYSLDIEGGIIKNLNIEGDFFGEQPILRLTNALVGTRYRREDLKHALRDLNVSSYILGLSEEELVEDLLHE